MQIIESQEDLQRCREWEIVSAVFACPGGHAVEQNSPGTASLLEKHTADCITKDMSLNQQRQTNDSR